MSPCITEVIDSRHSILTYFCVYVLVEPKRIIVQPVQSAGSTFGKIYQSQSLLDIISRFSVEFISRKTCISEVS